MGSVKMIGVESELRGKRIMVTGASGFIGSRLVQSLLYCGAKVVALIDENDSLVRIKSLLDDHGLCLVRCNLNDVYSLSVQKNNWGEIDLLAHLGLRMPCDGSFSEQSTQYIYDNVLPTMNLIKVLHESIQGICFTSSVNVYGYPARLPVRESDLPLPFSSYGATKLVIEEYLRAYGRATKVPVTILRLSTVYGPGEFRHRAVTNFLHNIYKAKPPVIYGDGSEIRDFVYIDDVVHAIMATLVKKPEQVLNIGSGRGYPIVQIAHKLIRLCESDVKPKFIQVKKKKFDLICDISSARVALDYSPQTNIEEGLAREIAWFKEQLGNVVVKDKKEYIHCIKNESGISRLFHYSFWKGVIDRLFALLLIIIMSPLLTLIAAGIKIDTRENPIFTQERVGKNGRKFLAYKFRTMNSNNNDRVYRDYLVKYVLEDTPYRVDHNGQHIYKVDNAPVTKFGAFLRRTNLDELPQFFNVLKGEMSLIGPRPDVPFAVNMYKDWHQKRLCVKPGITGLWQVSRRNRLSFSDMVCLDIEYIKRQSPILDFKIALLTIGTIIKGDGS